MQSRVRPLNPLSLRSCGAVHAHDVLHPVRRFPHHAGDVHRLNVQRDVRREPLVDRIFARVVLLASRFLVLQLLLEENRVLQQLLDVFERLVGGIDGLDSLHAVLQVVANALQLFLQLRHVASLLNYHRNDFPHVLLNAIESKRWFCQI